MHQHWLHADVAQEHNVEQRLVARVLNRVSADLDDHDLAVEALDVGQRLDENLGPFRDGEGHVV